MDQLISEAKKYGITVEQSAFDSVELIAPDGMCFEPGLHSLVNGRWDNDPLPNVMRSALRDLREHGPRLQKCADDCDCKDGAE